MLHTILYHVVLTAIFLYVLICIYIKVRFQFWSIQPVFHVYDFFYWIYPRGVVQRDLPLFNKYVDINNICVEKVEDVSEATMKRVTNFIQSHYLGNTRRVSYAPSHNSIVDYFKGSNNSSYISTFKRQLMYISTSSSKTTGGNDVYNLDELLGVFSARPLLITLKGHVGICENENENRIGRDAIMNRKTFPLYYCDNLCVHPLHRKKGIAPKLIQTQYYQLRRLNKNINTFLFKREGEMTAIVPLVAYESLVYSTDAIVASNNINTSSIVNVIEISEKNIFLFTQLLTDKKSIFDCIIVPEIGTLANLLKTRHILMYGLIVGNTLVSCYLFKYQYLIYNKDEHVIECIASINACKDGGDNNNNISVFFLGFKKALCSVIKRESELNRPIKKILIENTSHNNIIVDHINKIIPSPYSKTPCAFFLYNYISYSIQSSSCFILY